MRKGRSNLTGCTYFLTICLAKEQSGLDSPSIFSSCQLILRRLERANDLICHGFVLMPDHVHLLLDLNETESDLPSMMGLFKGRLSPGLRELKLGWQRGYFDRRLRETDSKAVVLRYMMMNPYRKGLIEIGEEWPYWECSDLAKVWLDTEVGRARPVPDWLRK